MRVEPKDISTRNQISIRGDKFTHLKARFAALAVLIHDSIRSIKTDTLCLIISLAVEYFERHSNYRDVSSLFQVGVGTLHCWVERFKQTDDIECFKPSGYPPLIPYARHPKLKEFVLKNAHNPLTVLSEKMAQGIRTKVKHLGAF